MRKIIIIFFIFFLYSNLSAADIQVEWIKSDDDKLIIFNAYEKGKSFEESDIAGLLIEVNPMNYEEIIGKNLYIISDKYYAKKEAADFLNKIGLNKATMIDFRINVLGERKKAKMDTFIWRKQWTKIIKKFTTTPKEQRKRINENSVYFTIATVSDENYEKTKDEIQQYFANKKPYNPILPHLLLRGELIIIVDQSKEKKIHPITFGEITEGTTATKLVTLKNKGNAQIKVSLVGKFKNGFTSETTSFDLPPKATKEVSIKFKAPSYDIEETEKNKKKISLEYKDNFENIIRLDISAQVSKPDEKHKQLPPSKSKTNILLNIIVLLLIIAALSIYYYIKKRKEETKEGEKIERSMREAEKIDLSTVSEAAYNLGRMIVEVREKNLKDGDSEIEKKIRGKLIEKLMYLKFLGHLSEEEGATRKDAEQGVLSEFKKLFDILFKDNKKLILSPHTGLNENRDTIKNIENEFEKIRERLELLGNISGLIVLSPDNAEEFFDFIKSKIETPADDQITRNAEERTLEVLQEIIKVFINDPDDNLRLSPEVGLEKNNSKIKAIKERLTNEYDKLCEYEALIEGIKDALEINKETNLFEIVPILKVLKTEINAICNIIELHDKSYRRLKPELLIKIKEQISQYVNFCKEICNYLKTENTPLEYTQCIDIIKKDKENIIKEKEQEMNKIRWFLSTVSNSIKPILAYLNLDEKNPASWKPYFDDAVKDLQKTDKVAEHILAFQEMLKAMERSIREIYDTMKPQSPWKVKFKYLLHGENNNGGLVEALKIIGKKDDRDLLIKELGKAGYHYLGNVDARDFYDKFIEPHFLTILHKFMQIYLYKDIETEDLVIAKDFKSDGIDIDKLNLLESKLTCTLSEYYTITLTTVKMFEEKFDTSKHENSDYQELTDLDIRYDDAYRRLQSGIIYDIIKVGITSKMLGKDDKPLVAYKI